MQPGDYRNLTFEQIRSELTGLRERVYIAWRNCGPCTTHELAERIGMSILTVRPRTTELYQLGLVELAPQPGKYGTGREGWYRAVELSALKERKEREAAEAEARPVQAQLELAQEA